jgi:hypothetical protein
MITKTTQIRAIRFTEATQVPIAEPKTLWVDTVITLDDPDDELLPVVKNYSYRLYADSDITQEPQMVKDIWNIVFATT